jgi:hypothetical protein
MPCIACSLRKLGYAGRTEPTRIRIRIRAIRATGLLIYSYSNARKYFICRKSGYKIYKCLYYADIKAVKKSKEVLELKVSENNNL